MSTLQGGHSMGFLMGFLNRRLLGTVVAALLIPASSFGHARLRVGGTLVPRNTNPGLKVGPCGNIPRTNAPTVLQAGQKLVVQWDEVIDHPGYYRIAFSPAGDAGFDQNVLAPQVLDLPNVHFYQTEITVPNINCAQCTIQLIQYMTESNPPSLYYSCADVEIRSNAPPAPSPTATPSPVSTPIPTHCVD